MTSAGPYLSYRNGHQRRWPFVVIGLTGSVAMGKSTAAAMIRRMGIAVFEADAAVHRLLGPQGAALDAIKKRFPRVVGKEGVDRQKLGALVFKDKTALADLEAILHPLVRANRHHFLYSCALRRARQVVLDIPLLFETGADPQYDAVIVVSAPFLLQRQRVMARPGMTEEKFAGILSRQLPDREKRRKATATIPTGLGYRETWRLLKQALAKSRKSTKRK